jgi:hypothetical protein
MKILPCLLIAAGAFASIATSKLESWELSQPQDLPASAIDSQTPSVRFLVHTELHGAEPIPTLGGILEVNISVKARAASSGSATIELQSLTHPDVAPVTHTVALNNTYSDYLSLAQWASCDVDPCVEDFEVVVERDPTADLPPIDVTGDLTTMAWADKGAEPVGAALDITVTPE